MRWTADNATRNVKVEAQDAVYEVCDEEEWRGREVRALVAAPCSHAVIRDVQGS